MSERLRTVSYGGGGQSTALLVLAAEGRIDFPTFLFANVGDDSEHPATLQYLHEFAVPFAEAHGIALHILNKTRRDGSVETLRGRITREGRKSQVIPVRSKQDGPPMSRSCTMDFKIRVLGKWLRANGASPESPALVGIGISSDEFHRANRKPFPYEEIVYPLLDKPVGVGLGKPLSRNDCERIIRAAGLPVPPKSSCYFCPYHRLTEWQRIRQEEPDLFADSCQLEAVISGKAGSPRYLTRLGQPLSEAVPAGVSMLPFADDDGACDGGVCFT